MRRPVRSVFAVAAGLLAAASGNACSDDGDHTSPGALDASVHGEDARSEPEIAGDAQVVDGGAPDNGPKVHVDPGPLWHLNDTLRGALGAPPGDNLFYSPLSIGAALGMVYAGAAGSTEAELRNLLEPEETPEQFHQGIGELFSELVTMESGGNTVQIANALFPRPGFELEPAFVQTLTDRYRAGVTVTDFAKPGAVSMINQWTAERTGGHIQKLFEAGQLDSSTVCALVNAIYFKATWKKAFAVADTRSEAFSLEHGQAVMVPMMHGQLPARLGEIGGAEAIELPYQGDELRFVAILPAKDQTVAALEGELATEDVAAALNAMDLVEAKVAMPSFTMRTRLDLIPPLKNLGVTKLFGADADLSRMSPSGGMVIDVVVHEAWVQVDENGSEAAAATGLGGSEFGEPGITLNRPFMFMIRDAKSSAILFEGRVMDPR